MRESHGRERDLDHIVVLAQRVNDSAEGVEVVGRERFDQRGPGHLESAGV